MPMALAGGGVQPKLKKQRQYTPHYIIEGIQGPSRLAS